nr:glycosyltransferase [Marmoricola endophyticus]
MERAPRPLRDARALWRWYRLLRHVRPDVVSIGTPKAALLGLLAAQFAGVSARVYKVRGLRLEGARGAGRLLLWSTEWITCGAAHAALVVSPSLRNRLEGFRLAPPRKLRVLGSGSSNGVDLERFATRRSASAHTQPPADRDEVVIAFVGRMSRSKGVPELCNAFEALQSSGIASKLLLVGDFEDEVSREAVSRLSRQGLPVDVVGFVDDVRELYGRVDVLCLPTHREGFPNVVLEAAAAAVPAVTTRATGAVDSVIDGVTGVLVPVGDTSALVRALATLCADGTLRRRMGTAARQRVAEEFDRRRLWQLEGDFYLEIQSASTRSNRRRSSRP